jgi:hypothetical protein
MSQLAIAQRAIDNVAARDQSAVNACLSPLAINRAPENPPRRQPHKDESF